MKYRHWFWDFDGTLFNTYPRICRAFQKSLADAGIFEDVNVILPYVKLTLGTAVQYFSDQYGISEQKILDGYHLHAEEEDMSTMRTYPGVHSFLESIKALGGDHFLYTHRGESAITALRFEQIDCLFTDIITKLDGFPAKPAPDALLFLISKYDLDPSECVMVGDRTIDLQAGLNAGIDALCMDPDGLCPLLDGIPIFREYQELNDWLHNT